MKKYFAAFLLLAALAAPARADDDALKKILQNRYTDLRTAPENGSAGQFTGLLAPGYTSTDLAGATRDANQIAAAVTAALPDDSRKGKTTVDTVTMEGDKAAVTQTYDLTTLRAAAGGGKIAYRMVTTSTDTWVKNAGAWLLQKTVAETGDVYINGRKAAHRVRAEAPAADKPSTP